MGIFHHAGCFISPGCRIDLSGLMMSKLNLSWSTSQASWRSRSGRKNTDAAQPRDCRRNVELVPTTSPADSRSVFLLNIGFPNSMKLFSKFNGRLLGKSKEKPDGRRKESCEASSPSATGATDLFSPPTKAAQASGPAAIITQPPPEQVPLPIPRPLNPTPASPPVASYAQPTPPDATTSPPSCDIDPWTRAYELVQGRELELMADYKKHLASLQDGVAAIADLSTPRSVESITKQLLEGREEKQWRVSLLGKEVKIREQAEKLTKFLLWTDPIVKDAVSAQPYAALAWSGVSLLLPVGKGLY
jgi:hypothetical protein